MGLRSYFVMKELKGDMQTLLNLDDYGYENSDSGETIRSCKSDQRGYDITNHSGMDVMRFYKRLLGRYRDALKPEINTLNSSISRISAKINKKDDKVGWAAGGTAGGVVASFLIPGGFLIGMGIAAASAAAANKLEDEKRELNNQRDRYQERLNEANEILERIKRIESSYDLGRLYYVCCRVRILR